MGRTPGPDREKRDRQGQGMAGGWPATAAPPAFRARPAPARGARPARENRSRMPASSKPGQRCASRLITSVRACAARSTTISRPPGRSTRAASASAPARVLGVVQHHLQHHQVEAGIGQRQAVHVGLADGAMGQPGPRQPRPRQRQHGPAGIHAKPGGHPRGEHFQQPPGAGADVQQPADFGAPAAAPAAPARPRRRAGRGRAFRPSPRRCGENSRRLRAPARPARARPAGGRRRAWRRPRAAAPAPARTSDPPGVAGAGRANQTFAPSRSRSSRPASPSRRRWRDSRGCDWPRMSVNSMTQKLPRAASARMRRRVGSAQARRAARSWSMGCAPIKISLCGVHGDLR